MDLSYEDRHEKQKYFIQNRGSEIAQRINQLSQAEDISCWSETKRSSSKHNELNYDNGSSKFDFITSKDNPVGIGVESLNGSGINPSIEIGQHEKDSDKTFPKYHFPRATQCCIHQESASISKTRGNQNRNLSIKIGYDNDNELSHTELPSNLISQKQTQLKKKINNSSGVDLKFMLKIKQRMSYYFKNFTLLGRTKQLNTLIRYYIGDKSDHFESQNQFYAFFQNNYLIYNIVRKVKHFNFPLIDCQSNVGMTISLVFILYNCLSMVFYSLYLVFGGFQDQYQLFCYVTSVVWAIEIIIKLNTSIFMKSKIIVERSKLIAVYMKKKVIFELLPLIIITTQSNNLYLQLLTLLKIFNIVPDLSKFQKYLCRVVKKYYFVILINLILKMFLIAHIIASLWYLLAEIENRILGIDSWIQGSIGDDGVWWKLYFQAVYWSLTLMTTGSNIASTSFEIIFTSIIMVFTTIAFGYLLNVVGFILETIDEQDDKKRRDINIINDYMRQKNISHQETLDELSLVAKEQFYLPHQTIYDFNINQEPSFLYLISGSAEIVNSRGESHFQTSKIKAGEIIGEYSFFTGMHQKLYIRSTEFTQVFRLSNADVLSIIKSNDKDFETFCQIRDSLLLYEQYSNVSLSCKVCGQKTHLIFDCPKLHLEKGLFFSKIGLSQQQEQLRKEWQRRVQYHQFRIFNQYASQMLMLQEMYVLNQKHLQSQYRKITTGLEENSMTELEAENNTSQVDQRSEQFTIREEEEDDYSNKNEHSYAKNELQPTTVNTFYPIQKRYIINCSSHQQFEDKDVFSPIIKIQSQNFDQQTQHSKEVSKDLKIITNKGNETFSDSVEHEMQIRHDRSEYYEQLSSQAKKSVPKFFGKNLNTLHSISSGLFFDFDETKQKNFKKQDKKSPRSQIQRKHTPVYSSQVIRFQQNQPEKVIIVHEKPLAFNPWTFEMLKDYNYYFKDGNSKKQISRHNKFIYKKIKQSIKKSPFRSIKFIEKANPL